MMRTAAVAVLGWLVIALVPTFLFSNYHLFQLTMVVVYAIAILGLAILTGFNGQISLGHGAFYAIGAYVTAMLMYQYDVPYWATLPVSAIVCAGVGFLIGLPALRLGGLYLALTTFALAVAVPQILKHNALEAWTGGVQGLVIDKPDPPFGIDMSPDQWLYLFTLFVAGVLFLLAWNIVRGRIGRAMMAIRDHALAAEAMGIDIATAEDPHLRAQRAVYRHRRLAWRHRDTVRCAGQFRHLRLDLFFRRACRGRRVVDRGRHLRRPVHRIRAQRRRIDIEGRARRGLWRDPDRGDVPDAGRRGRVSADLLHCALPSRLKIG